MRALLEFRERVKVLYSRCEFVLLPTLKFMLAYTVLCMANGKLGYMNKMDNLGIVLILSLLCSFLPIGFAALFAGVICILHMYTLSIEVALAGLIIFLVVFLLFLKFGQKDSLVLLLTVILFGMKTPYVIPILFGLVGTPISILPMACGAVVYQLIDHVAANAVVISNMGSTEATAKIRLVIDGIIGNKALLVMIVAFSVTIVIVYLIKRLSVDYSWTIAMVCGVIINIVVLLVGSLKLGTSIAIGSAILGSLLALVVGKIIEFFRLCVDYSRTEKLQFEDDEYYYYVKAVPKMTVSAPAKTVKKINAQRYNPERRLLEEEPVASRKSSRSVVTESTGRKAVSERGSHAGSVSITMNSEDQADWSEENYEGGYTEESTYEEGTYEEGTYEEGTYEEGGYEEGSYEEEYEENYDEEYEGYDEER